MSANNVTYYSLDIHIHPTLFISSKCRNPPNHNEDDGVFYSIQDNYINKIHINYKVKDPIA